MNENRRFVSHGNDEVENIVFKFYFINSVIRTYKILIEHKTRLLYTSILLFHKRKSIKNSLCLKMLLRFLGAFFSQHQRIPFASDELLLPLYTRNNLLFRKSNERLFHNYF